MAQFAQRFGVTVPPLDQIADTEPVIAIVNCNRWVVQCPDCAGAEFVWREGPHLLMCQSCWNSTVGHKWRRVVIPQEAEQVEAILEARPLPDTRNWRPQESLTDLADQNRAHGLEVHDGLV